MFFIEDLSRPDEISKFTFVADVLLAITRPVDSAAPRFNTEIVDYMAAGRPIISMMGSAEKQLISRAKCGYSAESGNAEELAQAILKLYRSPAEELERFGANAKAYQEEHFDREKNYARLLDVMLLKDVVHTASGEVSEAGVSGNSGSSEDYEAFGNSSASGAETGSSAAEAAELAAASASMFIIDEFPEDEESPSDTE